MGWLRKLGEWRTERRAYLLARHAQVEIVGGRLFVLEDGRLYVVGTDAGNPSTAS